MTASEPKGRFSALPPVGDMAAMIRAGLTIYDIAAEYGVIAATIRNKFTVSKWDPDTGQEKPEHRREALPLKASDTGSMHYVAAAQGGEYEGLPTEPVVYKHHKARFTGLDWDAIREQYKANGGAENASVWVKPKPGTAPVKREPSTYGGFFD